MILSWHFLLKPLTHVSIYQIWADMFFRSLLIKFAISIFQTLTSSSRIFRSMIDNISTLQNIIIFDTYCEDDFNLVIVQHSQYNLSSTWDLRIEGPILSQKKLIGPESRNQPSAINTNTNILLQINTKRRIDIVLNILFL